MWSREQGKENISNSSNNDAPTDNSQEYKGPGPPSLIQNVSEVPQENSVLSVPGDHGGFLISNN